MNLRFFTGRAGVWALALSLLGGATASAQDWTWAVAVDVDRSPRGTFERVQFSELDSTPVGFYVGSGSNVNFTYNYAARVGEGASIGTDSAVGFTTSSLVDGYAYITADAWDDLHFVSTGGVGPISATFEIIYQINVDYNWASASGSSEVYIKGDVDLKAIRQGSSFWTFDAEKIVETYYGDSSPYFGDFVNGSSIYTGAFTAGENFRFDLTTFSAIETTGANATTTVNAYLILRDVTDGFALVSASGSDYLGASAVPEPASFALFAGLGFLGFAASRRKGRAA